MSRFAVLLLATLVTATAAAQYRTDPQQYEKILLPLYTGAGGANGARWSTQLILRNSADRAVDAFPLSRHCISSAFCFRLVREAPAFLPHESGFHSFPTVRAAYLLLDGRPGVFFYVERDGADHLSMQLHVADTSRRPVALGTRVPVVREADFYESTVDIMAVPALERTRIALRIYEREIQPDARVRIRVYEAAGMWRVDPPGPRIEGPALLAEEEVAFVQPADQKCPELYVGCPEGFEYNPGHIEITDLLARFPAIATATGRPYGLRIEIEPLTPGLAFWPMVSVMEVDTSVVTLFTVQ